MEAREFCKLIAKGEFAKPTAGYCPGYVQTNLVILPVEYADDFEEFANKNSKAIPLLEAIRNSHYSNTLAKGANLLNELPSYDIIENGKVTKRVKNIEEYYQDDLVFFLIGCSFTFETSFCHHPLTWTYVCNR